MQDVVGVVHRQHGAAAQHDRPAGLDRGGVAAHVGGLLLWTVPHLSKRARLGVSGARQEHELRAAGRLALRVPRACTSASGTRSSVDDDVAAARRARSAAGSPRGATSSGGWATEKPRTSSETERIAGAGSVDRRAPASLPTWTWRAYRAAACIAASAGSPHSVSIVTSHAAAGGLAERGREVVVRVELDDRVGAALEQPLEALARGAPPRRRGPAPSSFAACTAIAADRAGRAEHEHRLARLAARSARRAPATPPRPVLPSAAATASSTPLGDVEQRVLGHERPLAPSSRSGGTVTSK